MGPEGKTSFPPGAPASFPVGRLADFLRNGVGDPPVSPDRAAGLGWQRPSPLGEWTGAGCRVRDVRQQPHIRCATLDSLDRDVIAHRVCSNSGYQQAAFGREYASTSGRPPGTLLNAVESCLRVRVHGAMCGERMRARQRLQCAQEHSAGVGGSTGTCRTRAGTGPVQLKNFLDTAMCLSAPGKSAPRLQSRPASTRV